jgi:hypothetical protein
MARAETKTQSGSGPVRRKGCYGGSGEVQESTEIYEELIGTLEEHIPSVAAQIREEVARGRLLSGPNLSDPEREFRESRLHQAKLARISKEDIAVVPYSGDDRLALLCQTLLNLAETMVESRRAMLELFNSDHMRTARVLFVGPSQGGATGLETVEPAGPTGQDGDGIIDIDLALELPVVEETLTLVRRLLEPVHEEVGEWR